MKARHKRRKRQRRLANRAETQARHERVQQYFADRAESDADSARALAGYLIRQSGYQSLDHSDPL